MSTQLTSKIDGDLVVLRVAGELDLASRDELVDAVEAGLTDGSHVALDLSELTFIDSSGLSALLRGRQLARDLDRRFVVRGCTGAVATVLELTGLSKAFIEEYDRTAHNELL